MPDTTCHACSHACSTRAHSARAARVPAAHAHCTCTHWTHAGIMNTCSQPLRARNTTNASNASNARKHADTLTRRHADTQTRSPYRHTCCKRKCTHTREAYMHACDIPVRKPAAHACISAYMLQNAYMHTRAYTHCVRYVYDVTRAFASAWKQACRSLHVGRHTRRPACMHACMYVCMYVCLRMRVS